MAMCRTFPEKVLGVHGAAHVGKLFKAFSVIGESGNQGD